jgi:hypothetical protein
VIPMMSILLFESCNLDFSSSSLFGPSSKQENLDELKSLMRNVSQIDKEYSNVLIMGDFQLS